MARRLKYRTYITRLWLAAMIAPPLVFFLFTLITGLGMQAHSGEPLLFATYLFIAFLFTVPTVLYIIIASMVIPQVSRQSVKLKRITIGTLVLGVIAVFFVVLNAVRYTNEQLVWGITFAILYVLAVISFGWRLKL